MAMAIRNFNGHTPQCGRDVLVDAAATVIGDVVLGDDCSVWPGAVIRGDVQRIRIGARVSVQDNAVLHVTHDGPYSPGGFALTIGDDVTIGHQAVLHGCTVQDRVLIGTGAIVMDGAVIESDVLLGAGALVPPGHRLAGGGLYVGQPARKIRDLSDAEHAFLRYSADNYVRLKNTYLSAGT